MTSLSVLDLAAEYAEHADMSHPCFRVVRVIRGQRPLLTEARYVQVTNALAARFFSLPREPLSEAPLVAVDGPPETGGIDEGVRG